MYMIHSEVKRIMILLFKYQATYLEDGFPLDLLYLLKNEFYN